MPELSPGTYPPASSHGMRSCGICSSCLAASEIGRKCFALLEDLLNDPDPAVSQAVRKRIESKFGTWRVVS
jgi:hypothetical protein